MNRKKTKQFQQYSEIQTHFPEVVMGFKIRFVVLVVRQMLTHLIYVLCKGFQVLFLVRPCFIHLFYITLTSICLITFVVFCYAVW